MSKTVTIKLRDLSERAAKVRADRTLRHAPSDQDLRIFSEHAKLMAGVQFEAIKSEKDRSDRSEKF